MTIGTTPQFFQLHNFHYGYLGEDWYEEYGSVERAVDDYLQSEDSPTLLKTAQEADELLADMTFNTIGVQLTQYFRPSHWTDDDIRAWIGGLRDRAQAELRARDSAAEGR